MRIADWIDPVKWQQVASDRRTASRLLRLVIVSATVAAIVWYVDWDQLGTAWSNISGLGLMLFAMTVIAFMALHCLRLSYILGISYRAAADVIFTFAWMRIFAPDPVIQGGRWLLLSRYTASKSKAFGGLVYGEALNLLVRACILGLLMLAEWINVLLLVGLAILLVAVHYIHLRMPSWFACYLYLPWGFHAICTLILLAHIFVNALMWYVAIRSAGVCVPFWECMVAQLMCAFLSKMPWTVGAIGIQEGLVVWLTRTHGIPSQTAFVIMVVLHSSWLLLAAGAILTPWLRIQKCQVPSKSEN